MKSLLTIVLRNAADAAAARQAARQLGRLLGFEHQDQVRIATAVSELVRWSLAAGAGRAAIELAVQEEHARRLLVIRVSGGHVRDECSAPRAAEGWVAAQRLLERFEQGDGADAVALARELPDSARTVDAEQVTFALREAISPPVGDVAESHQVELEQQSRELSDMLLELEKRQQELERLNAELADTNRGVMALYAELDERANHLRQADELKTRFFSNVSHEFRTPLNSVIALSRLLLEQADGPLNAEQVRQVHLIHDAANELYESVSDLLDLAKVEAGKSSVVISRFSVAGLFGALRGMLRPLLRESAVSLAFEGDVENVPSLIGDEGKVAQVLRNFLSNAVKFTERGSIRVGAELVRRGGRPEFCSEPVSDDSVLFWVTDTGIGISREDQELIFDAFTQIRHSLQRAVRGTGLGLPLCRQLAELMGGRVWVQSEPGKGSTFFFLVPRVYRPPIEAIKVKTLTEPERLAAEAWTMKLPLLAVSDDEAYRRQVERLCEGSDFAVVSSGMGDVDSDYLDALRPRAIIVDASPECPMEDAVMEPARAAGIPIITAGSEPGPGVDVELNAGVLIEATCSAVIRASFGRILLIDDDEWWRALLTKYVSPFCCEALPAADAEAALAAALGGKADCAVLDLVMPGMDGYSFLKRLRAEAATSAMPVLVCSSKTLSGGERELLHRLRAAFRGKKDLSTGALARGLVEAYTRTRNATAETPRAVGYP